MKLFLTVFWRSMHQHKKLLATMAGVMFCMSTMWVIEPLYGRYAIDQLLKVRDGNAIDFVRIFGVWVGIYVLVSLTQGINFYFKWRVQNYLLIDVREYYYDHLLRLDVHHHVKARGGELMKKLDNAADAAIDLARQILLELPASIITSIVFYIISFFISWKLALIPIVLVPFYILVIKTAIKETRKSIDTVNELFVKSIGRGYDTVANIFTVKSSGSEGRELSRMQTQHREAIAHLNTVNIVWALLEGIGYFMLLRILLIGAGMYLYTKGELSLGSVFYFQFGFFRMVVPLEMLSNMMPYWNEKMGKIRIAEEAFTKDIEIASPESPKELHTVKGALELDAISFSYEEADAISNISLSIKPGEHIAFVGHSGAGKSTMAALLNRFYDVQEGTITIDGIDLRALDIQEWRKHIGLVLQENIMFNDSVLDNIRYSRPEASDEEVFEAAKRAAAHTFIEKLPDGYNTTIGERGIRLSGGERQRIAIARAILKNPSIVVLDEATSALDSKTEQEVQEGIQELMKDKTSIVIAHRLSTVRNVDRIAVLEKGKLIACDTHEKLLQTCPIYKEMVELQSDGMLAE